MSFTVVLDSKHSSIVANESDTGMTWDEAIQSVLDYCNEAEYFLQSDFFEFVHSNREDYLNGNLSVMLA